MTILRKTRRELIVLIAMLAIRISGFAQPNLTNYNLRNQVNSSELNPAFLASNEKIVFSIFPLAGMTVGYNNQLEIKNMLLRMLKGTQDKAFFENFFNKMVDRGMFSQRMEFPLFLLSYHPQWGSFELRIKDVEQISSNLTGSFSNFLTSPSFQTFSLNQSQSFPAKASYYREYSLGISKEVIKNKLKIGIRTKLYFGKANLNSEVQGGMKQSKGQFIMQTYGPARLSIPLRLIQNNDSTLSSAASPDGFSITNYIFNTKNPGFGIDLGLSYRISPRLEFSASVIDFGKIKWNHYVSNMLFNGEYSFPAEYISTSGTDYLTKTPEFVAGSGNVSVYKLFKVVQDHSAYSTTMPTTFYAGMNYLLNPDFSIALVNRFIKSSGLNHNSLSVTGNYKLNNKLSVTSGYSIIGKAYLNMPLALVYNRNTSQTFIGTDNFLSFIIPNSTDFSGITFGTCFYLFKYKSKYKRQLDYQPYFNEKKPRPTSRKGLIFNNYKED